jgi:hypothetical protein
LSQFWIARAIHERVEERPPAAFRPIDVVFDEGLVVRVVRERQPTRASM